MIVFGTTVFFTLVVLVCAADIIDPAVLRPGRLDKTLYVGFPDQADRHDILRCITKVTRLGIFQYLMAGQMVYPEMYLFYGSCSQANY